MTDTEFDNWVAKQAAIRANRKAAVAAHSTSKSQSAITNPGIGEGATGNYRESTEIASTPVFQPPTVQETGIETPRKADTSKNPSPTMANMPNFGPTATEKLHGGPTKIGIGERVANFFRGKIGD